VKQTFILAHAEARRRAVQAVQDAPEGYAVTVAEPTRNLEQNAALWAILNEISEHVVWHGRKLSPEDWKHVFSASLKRLDVVPNLEGTGFVALGLSTSKMTKREFSDLLELVNAFAAEHGVFEGEAA
jgi:NinB protein